MKTYTVIAVSKNPRRVFEMDAGQDSFLAHRTQQMVRTRYFSYVIEWEDGYGTVYGITGQMRKLVLGTPFEKWINMGKIDPESQIFVK